MRTETVTQPKQSQSSGKPTPVEDRVAAKIKKVRELYADAPEIGRVALENGIKP